MLRRVNGGWKPDAQMPMIPDAEAILEAVRVGASARSWYQ
jgi:hypothetical protein